MTCQAIFIFFQTILESGGFPIIHDEIEIVGSPTVNQGGAISIGAEIGN